MKNIVLIGMMGSGKSMVARELSKRLKVACVSTDEMVEQQAGQKIKDIVAKQGWEYFRKLEHDMVALAAVKAGVVIDGGGGLVLNPKNLELLRKNGIIFYLAAPPAVLFQRLKSDPHRPLLQVADPLAALEKIYTERLPLYEQADFTIDASDASIEGPVVEILSKAA